jgi:glycosyltransferase involved in cell wall biosynthesis
VTDTAALVEFDVVVPTIGRPTLTRLLEAVERSGPPWPGRIIVVDDSAAGVDVASPAGLASRVTTLRTAGRRGPATARNRGWRVSGAPVVVFLDDDVVPTPGWSQDLLADLGGLDGPTAAVQARVVVPRSDQPTDWERNTAALEAAAWITADIAVRRDVLLATGGFDERFPRAYREDTDFVLRLMNAGWELRRGRRLTEHPARSAPWWASVSAQAGNADDVLLERLHGRAWRRRLGEAPGRFRRHRLTVVLAAGALGGLLVRRRRFAAACALGWVAMTGELVWHRVAPGPRTRREVAAMVVTSVAIPPAAVWHRARGRARLVRPRPTSTPGR